MIKLEVDLLLLLRPNRTNLKSEREIHPRHPKESNEVNDPLSVSDRKLMG